MTQKIATQKTRAQHKKHERKKIDQSLRWDSNFDGRDRSDKLIPLHYEWFDGLS
jgi:hypothetical protein